MRIEKKRRAFDTLAVRRVAFGQGDNPLEVKNRTRQMELFQEDPPPEVGSPELKFDLVLADGCKVSVHFTRTRFSIYPHFAFYGEGISPTGYRSHFFNGDYRNVPDNEIAEVAREIAEFLRGERIKETAKEARLKKRRVKA